MDYIDNHPLNPANQPEPVSVVSYEVEIDDNVVTYEFDTLDEAEKKFNELAFGTEHDWCELCIWKKVDGFNYENLRHIYSSTLFLEMKRTLARIREIESFPMDATSDEQQELVELKRKLYGNC